MFQLCWTPGGRHPAQEDNSDQSPLNKNNAGKSCRGCPGAATKHGNYKNVVTPWQCCSQQSKGHNSVSGRTVAGPALPILQPWLSTIRLLAKVGKVCLFWLVCCCWCCCFANSRPCKKGDLTTSYNTLFGQTQRLPKMAKAIAALWTAAESTLKIHDNFIAAGGFCFAVIEQFAQRNWP